MNDYQIVIETRTRTITINFTSRRPRLPVAAAVAEVRPAGRPGGLPAWLAGRRPATAGPRATRR